MQQSFKVSEWSGEIILISIFTKIIMIKIFGFLQQYWWDAERLNKSPVMWFYLSG